MIQSLRFLGLGIGDVFISSIITNLSVAAVLGIACVPGASLSFHEGKVVALRFRAAFRRADREADGIFGLPSGIVTRLAIALSKLPVARVHLLRLGKGRVLLRRVFATLFNSFIAVPGSRVVPGARLPLIQCEEAAFFLFLALGLAAPEITVGRNPSCIVACRAIAGAKLAEALWMWGVLALGLVECLAVFEFPRMRGRRFIESDLFGPILPAPS